MEILVPFRAQHCSIFREKASEIEIEARACIAYRSRAAVYHQRSDANNASEVAVMGKFDLLCELCVTFVFAPFAL